MNGLARRIVTAAMVLALGAGVTPASADEPAPLWGMPLVTGIGIGGSTGELLVQNLMSGSRPTNVAVPRGMNTVNVVAYFANFPDYGLDGSPISVDTPVSYTWKVSCGHSGAVPVTPTETAVVPVVSSTHITHPSPPPSLAVRAAITIPRDDCWNISISYTTPGGAGTYSTGVHFSYFDPANTEAFSPDLEHNGDLILYTLTDQNEAAEIRQTGALSRAESGLRYYFTNCAIAREFATALAASGSSTISVARIPTAADALGQVSGALVKRAGKSDATAWGVEQGVGLAADKAYVVASSDNPTANCGVKFEPGKAKPRPPRPA